MTEMGRLLERWHMDEAEVRRRMYRGLTPREWWHAMWLLTQGWTAAAGRDLERDVHTIGQWARAFAEGGPKALVFEQSGGFPRVGRGATRRAEVSSAAIAVAGGHRAIQLELESGASVCGRPLRVGTEPEQLSELPASAGVCAEASQEAVAQSRPSAAESFRGRVCGVAGDGGTDGNQDLLRRRGPLSGGC